MGAEEHNANEGGAGRQEKQIEREGEKRVEEQKWQKRRRKLGYEEAAEGGRRQRRGAGQGGKALVKEGSRLFWGPTEVRRAGLRDLLNGVILRPPLSWS